VTTNAMFLVDDLPLDYPNDTLGMATQRFLFGSYLWKFAFV
jgi:hypothetical protein